ncbi:hypothetical protein OG937_45505 [Streptomyces sp. NBC_00510]
MTTDAASDVIETAADTANVEGLWRSHSLRRGFVPAARAAGKDLVDIGRAGGVEEEVTRGDSVVVDSRDRHRDVSGGLGLTRDKSLASSAGYL